MPSSLNFNGLKIFRPGVYAEVDASALGGTSPSTGNVCIVGEFPSFEQNEALTFTSASALASFDPSDRALAHIGAIAFSPSLDERVPAGVASLTVLNVQPNTCAQFSFEDADGNYALVLKSSVWGAKGNRTQVSITNANTDQVNISVARDGVTESFEGIESGDVASVYYAGSLLDTVSLTGDRVTGLAYAWTQGEPMASGAVSFNEADMVSGAPLNVSLSTSAHTASVVVTIVGEDLEGVAANAVLTFSAGSAATQTTATSFGRVTSVSATSTDTAYTGTVVVAGGVSFNVADFPSLAALVSALDQLPNVSATYLAAEDYDADAFDKINQSIKGSGAAAEIRCDLAAILKALGSSRLVTAERAAGGVASVAQQASGSVTTLLSGGSSSASVLADWVAALATIESADLQILVPWSDVSSVWGAVKSHLRLAALAGRERNAWVGAAASQSLAALHTLAKSLNDRNMALVGQQIKHVDPQGLVKTLDPKWLALMLAAMQAGTPVATPLTRKEPNVVDVLGAWDANRDAGEAISKGICVLSRGPLGWRVERSVTTWLRDDNPVYSEVSANESVNASLRDLRLALDPFIGQGNVGFTANRLQSIVTARLNRQVLDGTIKAFRDVVIEALGDTVRVDYTLAAVEPINFVRVVAHVARF